MRGFFLADFGLTGAFLAVVLVGRLRLTGRRLFTISFSCLLRCHVTELPAGPGAESGSWLPPGAFQLPNDARLKGYVGAGPPEGTGRHRYIFAVLALAAEKIEIDREATPALLMFSLFSGTLGRAFLEGWYER